MNLELRALEDNGTWKIISLPLGKRAIGCKWLYKTKFLSDGALKDIKLDCWSLVANRNLVWITRGLLLLLPK